MALALAIETKSDRAKSVPGRAAKAPLHTPARIHTLAAQQAFGNRAVLGMLQRKTAPEPQAEDEAAATRQPAPAVQAQRKCACASCGETNGEDQPHIQTKLTVNEPGDIYEREADRVADEVMRIGVDGLTSNPQLQLETGHGATQRKCACGGTPGPSGECEECHKKRSSLQFKTQSSRYVQNGSIAPPIVNDVLHSLGQPLDRATRSFMEPRFGHDFSRVQVHTDRKATESAKAMNAMAYTVGQDVVFGDGKYAPATEQGRRLIAHELAHVVQASRNGAQAINRMATDEQDAEAALVGPMMPETTQPAPTELEGPPESETPQSSGPGPSGGKPDPSLPDCTAVMGGRQVDYWAAKIIRAQHTFMNFKLDASNYWLVEAGPLPSDPKKSGAWAKSGDWDTRGERVRKTFGKEDCTAMKDCLLDTTTKYHAAGVTYNPTSGPNSNSFMEHLTFKCTDLPKSFIGRDIAWDYWTTNPRPF